jgi:hypothetical protein
MTDYVLIDNELYTSAKPLDYLIDLVNELDICDEYKLYYVRIHGYDNNAFCANEYGINKALKKAMKEKDKKYILTTDKGRFEIIYKIMNFTNKEDMDNCMKMVNLMLQSEDNSRKCILADDDFTNKEALNNCVKLINLMFQSRDDDSVRKYILTNEDSDSD